MEVLVTYATAHGSTLGVATAIADRLRTRVGTVQLLPVAEVASLNGVDAVVIGSAIHSGAWLTPASTFVEEHTTELARLPVWLFSVSSVGATSSVFGDRVARAMRRMRSEPSLVAAWRRQFTPRGHRNFAGVVERSHWGCLGTLFVRALGGTFGDHRDWSDIDRWSDEIADALAAPPSKSGAHG